MRQWAKAISLKIIATVDETDLPIKFINTEFARRKNVWSHWVTTHNFIV